MFPSFREGTVALSIAAVVWLIYGCSQECTVSLNDPVSGSVQIVSDNTVLNLQNLHGRHRIEGNIFPPATQLSISYIGDCGQSYDRVVSVQDGNFTIFIPEGAQRIEFLAYTPKGSVWNRQVPLHYVSSPPPPKGSETACDYLNVRDDDPPQSLAYVEKPSCYEIGLRFGACASRRALNIECPAGVDTTIPFECRDLEETRRGIKDGSL
ncbi:MAG: hypothetical protein AB7S65_01895 [Sulfuricurvum sp.]